jgi:hypothetical protein
MLPIGNIVRRGLHGFVRPWFSRRWMGDKRFLPHEGKTSFCGNVGLQPLFGVPKKYIF